MDIYKINDIGQLINGNPYVGRGIVIGKTADGTLVLADEISPDTARFWDSKTHEKMDKDRFRRDMGGVEDAYQEILHRLLED